MKKIGGINMDLAVRYTSEKGILKRYCSVSESIEESLKEVKLHREGKKHLDTWEEYLRKKQKG